MATGGDVSGPGAIRSRSRNRRRRPTYSTARTTASTGAVRRANPVNVRSRWGRASRLVRFETGSRSDAEFAIRKQAKVPGSSGTDLAIPAPSTTGVSRTTVASRLRVAVTTAASTKIAGEQAGRGVAAPAADALGRGGEDPGSATDVGDHQDRDQEGDDGGEVVDRVAGFVEREEPGRQRDGRAQDPDRRLDPAARMAERHREHPGECHHHDDVGQGRHPWSLGCPGAPGSVTRHL